MIENCSKTVRKTTTFAKQLKMIIFGEKNKVNDKKKKCQLVSMSSNWRKNDKKLQTKAKTAN